MIQISAKLAGRLKEHTIPHNIEDSTRVKLRIGKKLVCVPIPSEEQVDGCKTLKCRYDDTEVDDIPEDDMANARFENMEFKIDKLVERLNELSK